MRRPGKRILAILLSVVICVSLLPTPVFADGTIVKTDEENSGIITATEEEAVREEGTPVSMLGTCGDDVTWTLDEDGILTISGIGEMEDYSLWGSKPWDSYRQDIKIVVIEDGVTGVGTYAFAGCSALSEVHFGKDVSSIGAGAFRECSSLAGITIPDGVESIRDGLFFRCSSLETIILPDSVTCIEGQAFNQCTALKSITIPESVTSIGESAFFMCLSLIHIEIPAGVASIEDDVFYGCTALANISVSAENANYMAADGVLFDKDQTMLICYPAAKTDSTYSIPNSVTRIADNGFNGAASLTSILIPEYVTEICYAAFAGCTGLATVTLPDGLEHIGNSAFSNCTALTGITIPDSVTSIGDSAFDRCNSLTSATIPAGVSDIGMNPFRMCASLTAITVSDDNAYYLSEDGVLFDKSMTRLISYPAEKTEPTYMIPDTVLTIDDQALSGCINLVSLTIGRGITEISRFLFTGCSALKEVFIPTSITNIGMAAFRSCSALTDIYYEGTEEEWQNISIDYYMNEALETPIMHYNYSGGGENDRKLVLNEQATAIIENSGDYAEFTFTPEETAVYKFFSISESDTYGYLYDAEMNLLDSNDDYGNDNDFTIQRELIAGETYVLRAKFCYSEETGSFSVMVTDSIFYAYAFDEQNEYATVFVKPGKTADLHVEALSSKGTLSYEWHDDNGSVVEEANGADITTAPIIRTQSSYTCYVSDELGNSASVQFTLYVESGLYVRAEGTDSNPVKIPVIAGNTVTCSVDAGVDYGGIQYKWYKQEKIYDPEDPTNWWTESNCVEGAESAALTTDEIFDNCQYYCNVYDDYGNVDSVYFYIYAVTACQDLVLNEKTAAEISTAEEHVLYSFMPEETKTYRFFAIADVDTVEGSLFDSAMTMLDEGYSDYETGIFMIQRELKAGEVYYLNIAYYYENTVGTIPVGVTDNEFHAYANETMAAKDTIYVASGDALTLHVEADTTYGAVSYQWYEYFRVYDDEDSTQFWYETRVLDGANSADYGVEEITQYSHYYCDVKDEFDGRARIDFYIYIDTGFYARAASQYVYAAPGESVTLSVIAGADVGGVTYKWSSRNGLIEDATGASLTVVGERDDTGYTCVVEDDYGALEMLYITVTSLLVEADGETDIVVPFGHPATVRVKVTAPDDAELNYRWDRYSKWTWIGPETVETFDNDSPVLAISAVTGKTNYICLVTDQYEHNKYVTFTVNISEDQELQSIIEAIDAESMSNEEVRNAVADLDANTLQAAMEIDKENSGIVETIAELETRVTDIETEIDVTEEMETFFAESNVSMIGAALNTPQEGAEKIVLLVDTNENEVAIPNEKADTVSVKFSMALENVEDPEQLSVPIKITLPLPGGIDPDYLVIYHYHDGITDPEEIYFTSYVKDGNTYVSFVVTSFSDFAMVSADHIWDNGEITTPPTCIVEGVKTFTCTLCGETKTEIIAIDPNAHAWTDPEWTWSADFSSATATFTCSACEGTRTVNAEVTRTVSGTTVTYTATVTFNGETYTDEQIVEVEPSNITSTSVDFNGKMHLITYIKLSDEMMTDEDAYIRVTFNGVTTDHSVAELIRNLDSQGRVKVRQEMYAAMMRDEMTLQVFDGQGRVQPLMYKETTDVTDGFVFTALEYLKGRQAESTNPYMVELAKAAELYGIAVQVKFGYNTDLLTEEDIAMMEAAAGEITIPASCEEEVTGALPAGITKQTKTVMFESDNTLRLYYYIDDASIGNYTFTLDGETVTAAKKEAGKYYVEQKNIASGLLSGRYTFTVSDGTNTYTIDTSALAYAYGRQENSSDQLMIDLSKLLYRYSQAADAYFG